MSRCIPGGISGNVPLFPPGVPVTIVLDGRPLAAYVRAYVAGGRVFAPVAPLITRLADRLWFEGDTLVVVRNGRSVRVRLAPDAQSLDAAYVPAGAALRALGATVRYEPNEHRLLVSIPPHAVVVSPTPFNAAAPQVTPNAVFTTVPPPTPRPVWTGSPLPRRTPLPLASPESAH
jgi:hypothetical protein